MNEVKVLMTMSDPGGTISRSLFKNETDGGSRQPILKTLGSTRILCPVAELSDWTFVDDAGSPEPV